MYAPGEHCDDSKYSNRILPLQFSPNSQNLMQFIPNVPCFGLINATNVTVYWNDVPIESGGSLFFGAVEDSCYDTPNNISFGGVTPSSVTGIFYFMPYAIAGDTIPISGGAATNVNIVSSTPQLNEQATQLLIKADTDVIETNTGAGGTLDTDLIAIHTSIGLTTDTAVTDGTLSADEIQLLKGLLVTLGQKTDAENIAIGGNQSLMSSIKGLLYLAQNFPPQKNIQIDVTHGFSFSGAGIALQNALDVQNINLGIGLYNARLITVQFLFSANLNENISIQLFATLNTPSGYALVENSGVIAGTSGTNNVIYTFSMTNYVGFYFQITGGAADSGTTISGYIQGS